jgi:DNA-binding CsgD family transcriptional regulator
MVPSATPQRTNATSLLPDSVGIDDLVREIVRKLLLRAGPGSPDQNGCASDEILLDTHVDGSRYVLIKMPAAEVAAHLLSPREQEIVRMVAKGYSNKVIADFLSISSWTVCTHLRRIFAKLGVGSRAAMVARLLKEGWVRDHTPPARTLTGNSFDVVSTVRMHGMRSGQNVTPDGSPEPAKTSAKCREPAGT